MPEAEQQAKLRAKTPSARGGGSSSSSGAGGGDTAVDCETVDRQPDGLPRLAHGLTYHSHYRAGDHCPVCSLDEGAAHAPAAPSHAAALLAAPQQPQSQPPTPDDKAVALMQSLQRPKHAPDWWGPKLAPFQAECARVLESPWMHYAVIIMTVLDLGVVVTELILSSIYPVSEHAPHAVHTAEDALSWTSITILSVFTVEVVSKLAVFGRQATWWDIFDALIVVTSLALELTLRGIAQEVASLLIFFRLWRILRVLHGVAETMELSHEQAEERHHLLIHGLQQDLALQHKRVRQLEREVAALAGAAAGAGVDVPSILRLAAAAASQPDLLAAAAERAQTDLEVVQAAAADAAATQQAVEAAAQGGDGGKPPPDLM